MHRSYNYLYSSQSARCNLPTYHSFEQDIKSIFVNCVSQNLINIYRVRVCAAIENVSENSNGIKRNLPT